MMAQRRVMMKYGGYSQSKKKRSYFRSMVVPMLCSGEYSIPDLIGVAKGYRYVLTHVARRGSNRLSQYLYKVPCALFYL